MYPYAEFALLDPEGTGSVPLNVMRERLHGEPFSLSEQEVRSRCSPRQRIPGTPSG